MIRSRALPAAGVLSGLVLAIAGLVFVSPTSHAASLEEVTGFGSNPGNLGMYSYRPDSLPDGAPLVVALHGCTQDASSYHANSGWSDLADQWGFSVVYPETTAANHALSCFRWFEDAHIQRGRGEALSIAQMVDYAVANYGSDPGRVFVTGLSAGGAMSAVMLATYPDKFAGGSVVAGLPYRCAPPNFPAICQYVGVSQTPQQWGDLVRDASPGYTGPWPRVAIWHGTSDSTVVVANATELVKQWTNVNGVPATPTSTESLAGNVTLDHYGGDVVRRYLVDGMGHGLPVDPGSAPDECGATGAYYLDTVCAAYHDAVWFGLTDEGGGPSPTPTVSPTPTPTVSPTPTPTPTGTPVCVTDNNYAHTQAGRAYRSGGYTYALGSDQNMGLWNVFVTTTLQRTAPDHWVIGC